MTFSSRLHLNKLATLYYLLYVISILISYIKVTGCNVHVLYKIIFSNKLGFILETSPFLYIFTHTFLKARPIYKHTQTYAALL